MVHLVEIGMTGDRLWWMCRFHVEMVHTGVDWTRVDCIGLVGSINIDKGVMLNF